MLLLGGHVGGLGHARLVGHRPYRHGSRGPTHPNWAHLPRHQDPGHRRCSTAHRLCLDVGSREGLLGLPMLLLV